MDFRLMGTMSDNNSYKDGNVLCLKKEIKAYKDKTLTGITDEERAEIEARIKEYLEENPIKTQEDRDAFERFVNELFSHFGFKGEIDSFLFGAGEAEKPSQVEESQQSSTYLFQRETLSAMALRNKLNYND